MAQKCFHFSSVKLHADTFTFMGLENSGNYRKTWLQVQEYICHVVAPIQQFYLNLKLQIADILSSIQRTCIYF